MRFETLEPRLLLSADLFGVPSWIEQGPGPIVGGQVQLPYDDDEVSGAVEVIAARSADDIFVGTVNGGIWHTTNGTADHAVWSPLTDQFPSLSVGDLKLSPLDNGRNTLFAGLGRFSSSNFDGGALTGVLRSTDGGQTWTLLGQGTFSGQRVRSIVPTSVTTDGTLGTQLVLAAGDGGVYRSTDGGVGWTRISGQLATTDGVDNDGNGVADEPGEFNKPDGADNNANGVIDERGEPGPPDGIDNDRNGLIDEGAEVNAADGLDNDGNGLIDEGPELNLPAAKASHLVLEEYVFAPGLPHYDARLYAAVPGVGIFRSAPAAAATDGTGLGLTWQLISNGLTFGLDSDGQDNDGDTAVDEPGEGMQASTRIELSVHEDVHNHSLWAAVIAPLGAPASSGGNERLAGLFRSYDRGTTWTSLPLPGLGGANPGGQGSRHFSILADPRDPDAVWIGGDRDTVEPYTGQIFLGNGVGEFQWHRFSGDTLDPSQAPHADSRDLVLAGTDILEADDGGIFRLSHAVETISVGGAPSDVRPTPDEAVWTSVNGNMRITEVISVAYDSLYNTIVAGTQDNGSIAQPGEGQLEWDQILGGDGNTVQVEQGSGVLGTVSVYYSGDQHLRKFQRGVVTDLLPDLSVAIPLTVAGTELDIGEYDGDGDGKPDGIPFTVPYVTNAVATGRLLIGTRTLFESFDRGDTVHPLVNMPSNITALAYGGFSGGVANPEVAWVAAGHDLRVRLVESGGFFRVGFPGGSIRDIVLDPDEWQSAYVLDAAGRVYHTRNAGGTWEDLTGDLGRFTSDLRSITLFNNTASPGDEVVLVGGQGGVYRRLEGAGPSWTEYGGNLPNAVVTDLRYDAIDDLLLAGTLGRGVWTLENVRNSIRNPAVLEVGGTEGDDSILLRTANNPALLEVLVNGTGPTLSVPFSVLSDIRVRGLGGSDALTLDLSAGNFIPPRAPSLVPEAGLTFDGGASGATGDRLVVIGAGASVGAYRPSGSTPGAGVLAVDDRALAFTGLEPVTVSGFASLDLITPNGRDLLVVDSPAPGEYRVAGSSGGVPLESLAFSGVGRFRLAAAENDGADPDDSFTFQGSAVGGTSATTFEILAGSQALGDRLDFRAEGRDVALDFRVYGGHPLPSIQAAGGPRVDFAGLERIELGGAGHLSVRGTSSAAISVSSPGTIRFGDGLVTGFDALAGFRFEGTDGNDTLTVAGDFAVPVTAWGGAGHDQFMGGAGSDVFDMGSGDDVVLAGGGDDTLIGGAGADTLDGGAGVDTASYLTAPTGVVLDLQSGARAGDAVGDSLRSIEGLEGTPFPDRLVAAQPVTRLAGLAGDDTLVGGAGDDLLIGGGGADSLDGQEGANTASYGSSPEGVTVDLAAGVGTGGDAEGDRLQRIQHLVGSERGDRLTGTAGPNHLAGLAGDDTLVGAGAGDSLDGGPGMDLASYAQSPAAVIVDLVSGTGAGGDAEGDGFVSVEDVDGSAFNDTLFASRTATEPDQRGSRLRGLDGDDRLIAGPLLGATSAGSSIGDWLDGGPGTDTVDYADSDAGVVVNLSQYGWGVSGGPGVGPVSADRGWARGDAIDDLENIIGSDFSDVLIGSDGDNVIEPRLSEDNQGWVIEFALPSGSGAGGASSDVVFGRLGTDTIVVDYSRRDTGSGLTVGGGGTQFDYEPAFQVARWVSPDFTGPVLDRVDAHGVERLDVTGTRQRDYMMGFSADDVFRGGEGDDYVFPGPGGGDFDGGPGADTLGLDLSGLTVPVVLDSAQEFVLDGAPFPLRIADFEAFGADGNDPALNGNIPAGSGLFITRVGDMRFLTGGGDDVITLHGRHRDIVYTGPGNDTVSPGLGQIAGYGYYGDPFGDYVNGGAAGDDLLVLDYSVEDTGSGIRMSTDSSAQWPFADGAIPGRVYRTVSPAGGALLDWIDTNGFERVDVTGTSQADSMFGGRSDDRLVGAGGDDAISAGGGNDSLVGVTVSGDLPGRGEIDLLNGWNDADRFVLGDAERAYYDDGDPSSDGAADHARIPELDPARGAVIQLHGVAGDYRLAPAPGGTQLLLDKPGSEPDELIALIQSAPPGLSLAQGFVFVSAPAVAADAYSTDAGVTLSVPAPGVLANDSDANGDPLAAVLDTPPAHGTLALAADGSFSYTPEPGFAGTDGFTYRASDGGAESHAAVVSITVRPAGLRVVSLEPLASGFRVRFSEAIDPSTLELYGGPGAADVTLSGDAGRIGGSLVLDGDRQGFRFIKTGAVLGPGAYTVALRGASDGFRNAAGVPLDGDGDGIAGGDARLQLIAAPVGRSIGLPDVMRGPGQPVDVPATAAHLPLTLSEGAGVGAVELDLSYDPALLAVSGIAAGLGLPAGSDVTLTGVPGAQRIRVEVAGVLGPGRAEIARLIASVPDGARAGAAQVLDLSAVTINAGAIAAADDDAVQVVGYLGDATGDGQYTREDAERLGRVVVRRDSGFAAFPSIDPVVVADVTGDGRLTALDGSRILQEATWYSGANALYDRPEIPPLAIAGPAATALASASPVASGAAEPGSADAPLGQRPAVPAAGPAPACSRSERACLPAGYGVDSATVERARRGVAVPLREPTDLPSGGWPWGPAVSSAHGGLLRLRLERLARAAGWLDARTGFDPGRDQGMGTASEWLRHFVSDYRALGSGTGPNARIRVAP